MILVKDVVSNVILNMVNIKKSWRKWPEIRNIPFHQGGDISLRHLYCHLKARGVRSIDNKSKRLRELKTLIYQGF